MEDEEQNRKVTKWSRKTLLQRQAFKNAKVKSQGYETISPHLFCHSVLNCVAIDLPYNFEEILRHATHVEISQSSLTMLDGQSI